MSTPYGFCITRQGNALLAKLLSSEQLKITRVMIGGGRPAEGTNLMDLTDLIKPIARATSTLPITVGTTTSFVIEYRNDMGGEVPEAGAEGVPVPGNGLGMDISINEFSVHALDPDEGEIMLYYGCLGDYPDSVKAYAPGDPVISRRYPVSITVVEGVEVVLDYAAGAYMTAEDIAEYCQKTLLPQFMELLPEKLEEQIKAHNLDSEAHPLLLARMGTVELTLNGSITLFGEGDPTIETVGKKRQHYINISTGAEWECTNITDEGYTWELVDYNSENYKSMRDLLADAAATAAQAKEVADGAAKAIAAVQNTISVVPSQSGSLIFNGSTQLPSWNNLALEMMDITYGEDKTPAAEYKGETDAGTYRAYVKPKEGFTWGDKSADEKEILWTIQRATITTVPSVSGSLAYTGEAQAPTWLNFNPAQLTKEETAQTNAGEHATSFAPTKNYQWSGGDTSPKVVKWTIAKAANAFSVAPSGAQSVDVGDTVVIQVTSNSDAPIAATADNPASVEVTVDMANKRVTIKGASQGSANVTITSQGSSNYTDASAVIGVNVSRKVPTFSINPSGNQTLSIGGSKQIAVTTNSDGAVSASSSAPGVATASANGKNVTLSGASAGSSTITISVAQTTKYEAARLTLSVTVSKPTVANSTWDDIKAISDAGTAASYFAPGDTKGLTLNGTVGTLALSNLKVDAFILGINHNASREGSNRIHWAIGKIGGTLIALCDSGYNSNYTDGNKRFNMNHWGNYNRGGWKGCDLRYDILGSTNRAPSGYGSAAQAGRVGYDPSSYDIVNSPVANTLMAAMPQAVRKVMKTVTKYTDNVGNASGDTAGNVTASVDYFFLLAEHEVYGGNRAYANSYEKNYQVQYDYFKAGNSKQVFKHDARTTAVWGPLRSPYYSYNRYFSALGSGGSVNLYGAANCGGLLPGFST